MANGSFTVDASGWTAMNGTIASVAGGQSGNCLQITMVSGTLQYADSSPITTVAGKLYRLTVYVQSGTGGTAYIIQAYNSGKTVLLNSVTGNTTGTWTALSFVFRATDAASYVRLIKFNSAAGTMLFDEISVNEVTPGCVAADPLAMDDWTKTSGDIDLQAARRFRIHQRREPLLPQNAGRSLRLPGLLARDHNLPGTFLHCPIQRPHGNLQLLGLVFRSLQGKTSRSTTPSTPTPPIIPAAAHGSGWKSPARSPREPRSSM